MEKKVVKLIKRSRLRNHRSLFVLLGSKGYIKVPYLYKLVTRDKPLPVIWFSSEAANKSTRKIDWSTNEKGTSNNENNEECFIPEVTYLSFSDIQYVSTQPSHFVVVQDMKDIKPSDLVSIIEAISGKGALIFLFTKISESEKFVSPTACDFVTSRFMKRLFASFISCQNCLILDDELNVLFAPKGGSETQNIVQEPDVQEQPSLPLNNESSPEILDKLTKMCMTRDQTNFLVQCFDSLNRRTSHCTISASSQRGRGTPVVLGLAIAGAIAMKYSNIFISSLCYENVKLIFKYLLLGLDTLQFKEDEDYDLIQSVNPKFHGALLGLNIFHDHPQAVRFIFPGDIENKLEQAELVVISEPAAMPFPLLKKLIGPYVVLMASTVEGYGGSGKYLYENMVTEIRRAPSSKTLDKTKSLESLFPTSEISSWKHINLLEPVNYSSGDAVEQWINRSLCTECSIVPPQGCPDPTSCNLYYVCKETLFSYEPYAENFLQRLMSLFSCTKKTISPDILKKIADDSDYHIFCLLPPFHDSAKGSSDILSAILVHSEKDVPWNVVYCGINQSKSLQECFNEWTLESKKSFQDFCDLQGVHIEDIVTYPNYRKMGYGSRALQLMQEFYDGKAISLDEKPYIFSMKNKNLSNDTEVPLPLLLQLTEVEPKGIDYILVSYYLTPDLLRFWKKVEFVPVYVSGEKNTAQEHLCFMIKGVSDKISNYMVESWRCFREYYFLHLSSYFKYFSSELALNLLNCKFSKKLPKEVLTKEDIDIYLKPQRMKALDKYCQNLGDLHCIMPCIPILAKLFFRHHFVGVDMPVAQQVILLAFGIQHKTIEEISSDLSLHTAQVHGLLNRTIKKLTTYLTSIIEKAVEKTIAVRDVNMEPVAQSLDDELEEAAQKIKEKQLEDLKRLKEMDFSEFAIKGSEDDWEKALHSGRKTLVSIKSLKKAPENVEFPTQEKSKSFHNKKKDTKRKKKFL